MDAVSRSDELRATLDHLHAQLGEAEALDETVQAQLRRALEESHSRLEREDQLQEQHSLAERLSELRKDFKESHPTLAAAVGRVVDALTNLGI